MALHAIHKQYKISEVNVIKPLFDFPVNFETM